MSNIQIYVLSSDGRLDHISTGSIDSVVSSLGGRDFTLTKPPNYEQPWYWYDNAWQSEPKPTP